jgi:hypothetical protein
MNESVQKREQEQQNRPERRTEQAGVGEDAMRHDSYIEQISLWLDNELSPAEASQLQAHLAQCPVCRQTQQAMVHLDGMFRQAASLMAAPLPGFGQRVEVRLAHYHPASQRRLLFGMSVLLLGTLALALLGGLFTGLVLLNTGSSLLDVALIVNALENLFQFINAAAAWLNFGSLFLKASLITMGQPLFWVCALAVLGAVWLWLRVLNSLNRRPAGAVELLI